jgi:hypothetical protein
MSSNVAFAAEFAARYGSGGLVYEQGAFRVWGREDLTAETQRTQRRMKK